MMVVASAIHYTPEQVRPKLFLHAYFMKIDKKLHLKIGTSESKSREMIVRAMFYFSTM